MKRFEISRVSNSLNEEAEIKKPCEEAVLIDGIYYVDIEDLDALLKLVKKYETKTDALSGGIEIFNNKLFIIDDYE